MTPQSRKRIPITGAMGQLGRALQTALPEHEVVALGHAELDITDSDAVHDTIRAAHPDIVIHAAAWTDTAGCERDPDRAIAVNAGGARNVAEACRETGAAMLYVGSNEVFDGDKGTPYVEDDATHAINEYGRSKLLGEDAVRATLDGHYIVRTSWLFGPGRVSFPEKIVLAALEHGKLRLVTDEIANPTWTVDLASAIATLVRTEAWGTYHLTNEGACSRMEWALEVLRFAGLKDIPVEPATQADFGGLRKPVNSALANVCAAALGITLPPWRDALANHFRHPDAEIGRVLGAHATR